MLYASTGFTYRGLAPHTFMPMPGVHKKIAPGDAGDFHVRASFTYKGKKMDFSTIAPYLKDPLVLIGFVVFLGFTFSRYLVQHKVIPELPPQQGFIILKQLLLYGFVIGLLVIGLGFGLKYKELNHAEQNTAFQMLKGELKHNLITTSELSKNMLNILDKQKIVSEILRTDGIEIFEVLFPYENIELNPSVSVQSMVDTSFEQLILTGLINNELQLYRFNAAGKQVNLTIDNTLSVLRSLQDESGSRYTVKREVWESNLPIYRKINEFDVTVFQKSLTALERLRTNYDVTVKHAIDYLNTVKVFFSAGNAITKLELYKVLSKERFSLEITTEYSAELIKNADNLIGIEQALTKPSN